MVLHPHSIFYLWLILTFIDQYVKANIVKHSPELLHFILVIIFQELVILQLIINQYLLFYLLKLNKLILIITCLHYNLEES